MLKRLGLRWGLILVLIGLVYLIYVWDRLVVAILLVEIRKAFSLSLPDAGFLATVFTLGITLGAIPAGFVTARIGTKWALALGALIFSLCTIWTAVSPNVVSMFASRVGGGLGEALFNVALYSFLAQLTRRYKGAAAGFPATIFGIGVFSGPLAITGLFEATGAWQRPFLVLGGLGLLGALIIALALPSETRSESAAANRSPPTLLQVRSILTPATVTLLFVVAVNGIAIYSFLGLFHTFLRDDRALAIESASLLVSLFGAGQLLGGLPMGYLADVIGRRLYLIVTALVTAAAGYGVFGEASFTSYAVVVFLFGVGTNSIYANCIALIQEEVGPAAVPLATGMLAAVYFMTAAFSGLLLANLKAAMGWQGAGIILYTVPFIAVALAIGWSAKRPRVFQPV